MSEVPLYGRTRREQLLDTNLRWFRVGLISKAHGHFSSLNCRIESNKELEEEHAVSGTKSGSSLPNIVQARYPEACAYGPVRVPHS